MNLIDAIKLAKEQNLPVFHPNGFNYTDRLCSGPASVGPGKISPEYLLAIIGQIYEADLLSNDWDVEWED